MARAIWTGTINFGLVTVPIELYSATVDHSIHFHQFERGTSNRIRYRMVNEETGKEVAQDDIVKGYEVSHDDYVIVEPEELDDIAPGRSRTIDIENFVDLSEVDPIFFEKTYLLAPAKKEFDRAYGLLAQAMGRPVRQASRNSLCTARNTSPRYGHVAHFSPWICCISPRTSGTRRRSFPRGCGKPPRGAKNSIWRSVSSTR